MQFDSHSLIFYAIGSYILIFKLVFLVTCAFHSFTSVSEHKTKNTPRKVVPGLRSRELYEAGYVARFSTWDVSGVLFSYEK
jgi:hypothetical protein